MTNKMSEGLERAVRNYLSISMRTIPELRHTTDLRHFYYTKFNGQKYGIMYDIVKDLVTICKVEEGQNIFDVETWAILDASELEYRLGESK